MPSATKRKCPLCGKEYELTEYAIHLMEEQLKQLSSIKSILVEMNDATQLTYMYMKDDDDSDNLDGGTGNKIEDDNDDFEEIITEPVKAEDNIKPEPKKLISDETYQKVMDRIKEETQP